MGEGGQTWAGEEGISRGSQVWEVQPRYQKTGQGRGMQPSLEREPIRGNINDDKTRFLLGKSLFGKAENGNGHQLALGWGSGWQCV